MADKSLCVELELIRDDSTVMYKQGTPCKEIAKPDVPKRRQAPSVSTYTSVSTNSQLCMILADTWLE